MTRRPKNSTAEQLKRAKIALTNTAGDNEIQSAVAAFGYNETTMATGWTYYNDADAAVASGVAAAGARSKATDDVRKAEKDATTAYQRLSVVAKALLQNDKGSLAKLGLDRPMPRTIAAFLSAAYILFDNASGDTEIREKLSTRGYDDAKLAQERARIKAYDDADDVQEAAKGANQQATSDANAAMKRLNDWISQYLKIARVALSEKKNLLEKLGITVRTAKTAAQREAPAKAATTRKARRMGAK
jgi:hypothetical protein